MPTPPDPPLMLCVRPGDLLPGAVVPGSVVRPCFVCGADVYLSPAGAGMVRRAAVRADRPDHWPAGTVVLVPTAEQVAEALAYLGLAPDRN